MNHKHIKEYSDEILQLKSNLEAIKHKAVKVELVQCPWDEDERAVTLVPHQETTSTSIHSAAVSAYISAAEARIETLNQGILNEVNRK